MKTCTFSFILLFSLQILWSQNPLSLQKIRASDPFTDAKFGQAIDLSGNYAIVGAQFDDRDENAQDTLTDAGAAYIFERDPITGAWSQKQKLVASDRATDDRFGYAVAIDGNYAVVGAKNEDEDENGQATMNNAGSAYFFKRNAAGVWEETQKVVSWDNRKGIQFFGHAVDIHGNYAAIGAPDEGRGANPSTTFKAGAVFTYERDANGTWISHQKLRTADLGYTAQFGISISMDRPNMIIGAVGEREDAGGANSFVGAGAAYIFTQDPNSGLWAQSQKLTSSQRGQNNFYGYSVTIAGNYAAIGELYQELDTAGANLLSSAGAVYIVEQNNNGIWSEVLALNAPSRKNLGFYGESVSMSGDRLLVASQGDDEDAQNMNPLNRSGSAYLYKRSANELWSLDQKIVSPDRRAEQKFGTEVCLNGSDIMISLSEETHNPGSANRIEQAGSVYISGNRNSTFIEPISKNEVINVYPNPSNGKYFLDVGDIYHRLTLKVFTMAGQCILHEELEHAQKTAFSFQGVPGSYMVVVSFPNGKVGRKKLIKY